MYHVSFPDRLSSACITSRSQTVYPARVSRLVPRPFIQHVYHVSFPDRLSSACITSRSQTVYPARVSRLVPRPFIQRVYRFQYNAILKAIRAGVGWVWVETRLTRSQPNPNAGPSNNDWTLDHNSITANRVYAQIRHACAATPNSTQHGKSFDCAVNTSCLRVWTVNVYLMIGLLCTHNTRIAFLFSCTLQTHSQSHSHSQSSPTVPRIPLLRQHTGWCMIVLYHFAIEAAISKNAK